MNMKALIRGALFVGAALGLTVCAGAGDYNFAGVDPPAYYQATSYESVYGSGYNYGGANVVDYRMPELSYGLATQPSTGVAEQIRLSVGGSVGSAYAGGSGADGNVSYGVSSLESVGDFFTPTYYAQGADALSLDALYPASAFFETTTVHVGGAEAAYTSVSGMKRSDGSIGTVKIPSLGITRKVWEGETTTSMSKGMGHYSATSAWDGNVGVCGHNRGSSYAIGSIKNWTVENFVRREMKKGRTNSAQITRKHQEKCARENSMPHLMFFRIPLASERFGLFALWSFQAGKP